MTGWTEYLGCDPRNGIYFTICMNYVCLPSQRVMASGWFLSDSKFSVVGYPFPFNSWRMVDYDHMNIAV